MPGTYNGGIFIDGSGPVTLMPGVYYMKGGGFTVTGQGSVSGSGVVIINAPSGPSDTISVNGQGKVNLTAPTTGPFMGVVLFQDPASGNSVHFAGQAVVTLTGVVYVPRAEVDDVGNANVTINAGPGTSAKPLINGALIAFDLKVDGNGILTVNPDPPDPPGGGAAPPGGRRNGGGTQGNNTLLPQDSLVLSGGGQVDGSSLSSAPVTRSGASRMSVNQTALDHLFSGSLGGTGAALSGESNGVQLDRSTATWVDPLSGQLVDELVSNLAQVA